MEEKLSRLVERLKSAFGDRLVAVVLYGSGGTEDWNKDSSDLNVLCVLSRITPAELGLAEPILHWWQKDGNPPPLLLTADEVPASTDCFPMEFHDMQRHRRVLYGSDVIASISVENKYYRAQLEHELRAKQLRLRQRAAEVLSQPDRLRRLMTDSVSTFCVLGRHALILGGQPSYWKKQEVVAALANAIGSPLNGIDEILALRTSGKRLTDGETVPLLERYLVDITALVRFVDAFGG